jgi:small nuclear ribonucleoprotein (snRNP)-like protein
MILENVTEMWTEVIAAVLLLPSAWKTEHVRSVPAWGSQRHAINLYVPALQIPKTGKGKKSSRPVNKDRFVNKMFLRGDSVVLVL